MWKILKNFHNKNNSLCDFIFLTIYFLIQFFFLLLYNLFTQYRELWIGFIILSITTTASLERFMMNIRHKKSSGIIRDSLEERKDLLRNIKEQKEEIKFLKKENDSMFQFIKNKLLQ